MSLGLWLLLAKIVGCYITCSINLYGCIGYIYCRNDFSVTFVLVWVGNKNIVIFMKFSFQNNSVKPPGGGGWWGNLSL